MWWSFLKAVMSRRHRLAPATWVVGIAGIVYAFAPIDLIPELLLGPLGFADDLGVWGILAALAVHEHRRWLSAVQPA